MHRIQDFEFSEKNIESMKIAVENGDCGGISCRHCFVRSLEYKFGLSGCGGTINTFTGDASNAGLKKLAGLILEEISEFWRV